MPFSLPRILLFAAVGGFFIASQVHAQEPTPQPQDPKGTNGSDKVWTDDNIKTVHGQINVVGGSSADDGGTSGEFGTRSNGATFVSPTPGERVAPGETVQVEYVLDSGIVLPQGGSVMTRMASLTALKAGPPYSFNITIPKTTMAGDESLIGRQLVAAVGGVKGREDDPILAETYIDVEEREMPTSMYAVDGGGLISGKPQGMQIFGVGMNLPVGIYARFPNGEEWDVTRSTYLQLTSDNPHVVRREDAGGVVAVGQGTAHLVATYTIESQKLTLLIDVTVRP